MFPLPTPVTPLHIPGYRSDPLQSLAFSNEFRRRQHEGLSRTYLMDVSGWDQTITVIGDVNPADRPFLDKIKSAAQERIARHFVALPDLDRNPCDAPSWQFMVAAHQHHAQKY